MAKKSRYEDELNKYMDLFRKAILRELKKDGDYAIPINITIELHPNEFGCRMMKTTKITQEDLSDGNS